MPFKPPIDENVRFLYSCLLRSDYHSIDFNKVGKDFEINPPAARMRWARLRRNMALHAPFKNDPGAKVLLERMKITSGSRASSSNPRRCDSKRRKLEHLKKEIDRDSDDEEFMGNLEPSVKKEEKGEEEGYEKLGPDLNIPYASGFDGMTNLPFPMLSKIYNGHPNTFCGDDRQSQSRDLDDRFGGDIESRYEPNFPGETQPKSFCVINETSLNPFPPFYVRSMGIDNRDPGSTINMNGNIGEIFQNTADYEMVPRPKNFQFKPANSEFNTVKVAAETFVGDSPSISRAPFKNTKDIEANTIICDQLDATNPEITNPDTMKNCLRDIAAVTITTAETAQDTAIESPADPTASAADHIPMNINNTTDIAECVAAALENTAESNSNSNSHANGTTNTDTDMTDALSMNGLDSCDSHVTITAVGEPIVSKEPTLSTEPIASGVKAPEPNRSTEETKVVAEAPSVTDKLFCATPVPSKATTPAPSTRNSVALDSTSPDLTASKIMTDRDSDKENDTIVVRMIPVSCSSWRPASKAASSATSRFPKKKQSKQSPVHAVRQSGRALRSRGSRPRSFVQEFPGLGQAKKRLGSQHKVDIEDEEVDEEVDEEEASPDDDNDGEFEP